MNLLKGFLLVTIFIYFALIIDAFVISKII
jgi:hypothetical protein